MASGGRRVRPDRLTLVGRLVRSAEVGPFRAEFCRVVGVHLALGRQVLANACIGSVEIVGNADHRLVERDEVDLVAAG